MFVKICGTTNLQDAALSVQLGADALGFIFAPSKRHVTVAQAQEITREMPKAVLRVGVFTQPDIEGIAETVRQTGLTAVQMHWPYDGAQVQALRAAAGNSIALWQVVGYAVDPVPGSEAEESFAETFRAAMADQHLAVVLLDAVKGGVSGGQGEAFSWRRAAQVVHREREAAAERARAQGRAAPQLIVAGGLRADNVAEAIEALAPWGVDVVSGVEAGPGKKSPDRLRAFLAAAKRD